MNPRFIVHDRVGRTWHFETEAQVLGFVALRAPEYVAYYRDDYVAELRAEGSRLRQEYDRDISAANETLVETLAERDEARAEVSRLAAERDQFAADYKRAHARCNRMCCSADLKDVQWRPA